MGRFRHQKSGLSLNMPLRVTIHVQHHAHLGNLYVVYKRKPTKLIKLKFNNININ